MSTSGVDSMPLLDWRPTCRLLPYPLVNRVGKIRDVASKLLDKPTEKSAIHYRLVVTEALQASLSKIGLGRAEIDLEIGLFWTAVENELARQTYGWRQDPDGGAA
ncbi:hypothetical protein PMI07_002385 [Rhizobium sp. CF080]|uniref:DUF6074 family protein n=1 Tax=Rhizobium sp. (strain CF080) TaxID=1144310 RepID=UPI0003E7E51B|nr:DUF6074 family protein [Rhizobium sp. CF080]EUB95897.1 hypothetical protein PMI07_002385 [Rhizobium sp. CF080]